MTPPNSSQRQRMKDAFKEASQPPHDSPTLPAVAPEVALRVGQIIGKCSIVRELGRDDPGDRAAAVVVPLDPARVGGREIVFLTAVPMAMPSGMNKYYHILREAGKYMSASALLDTGPGDSSNGAD